MDLPLPEWPRRLSTRVVVGCATLGPLGQRLPAPGTWGSLAGLLYFELFFARLTLFENLIVSALASFVAVGICGEAEVRLGQRDPGKVVLDETVAMPLCFLGWHQFLGVWPHWAVLLAGFVLFRLFDILKPFRIRRLQTLPGGWGVVVDDLAAALVACFTLHVLVRIWAFW